MHGGGFAGTIQAFVKNDFVEEYRKALDAVFGEGSCHVLKVRKYGGMRSNRVNENMLAVKVRHKYRF